MYLWLLLFLLYSRILFQFMILSYSLNHIINLGPENFLPLLFNSPSLRTTSQKWKIYHRYSILRRVEGRNSKLKKPSEPCHHSVYSFVVDTCPTHFYKPDYIAWNFLFILLWSSFSSSLNHLNSNLISCFFVHVSKRVTQYQQTRLMSFKYI